ncbi:MAG TPA: sulfotransferase [Actinomycetota bacterium]|nr:sulfotransferase [Actinomycetota bacterium]
MAAIAEPAGAAGAASDPTPLFLLSLPRSGSTLLQRVLATHPEVGTVPEPWLLLPQLYARRGAGVYAEYGYGPSSRAIDAFADGLPGGSDAYDRELREFVLHLYRLAAGGAPYFLDKTPRYHLVADELITLFPEAKVVVLWRNPLAVVASIVETWAGGRWTFGRWHVDLHEGLESLVRAAGRHAGQVHSVRFEDLVREPDSSWPGLMRYLDLPHDPAVLTSFAETSLESRMGDATGTRAYRELSTEPLEKWRRTFSNPLRRDWGRRYLRWIGEERLAVMGYDLACLLDELSEAPSSVRMLGSDTWRTAYAGAVRRRRDRAFHLLTKRGRW